MRANPQLVPPSPEFLTTSTGGRLTLDRCIVHQPFSGKKRKTCSLFIKQADLRQSSSFDLGTYWVDGTSTFSTYRNPQDHRIFYSSWRNVRPVDVLPHQITKLSSQYRYINYFC
ncbi:hypothetical protein TNCV_4120071 [Trichonephila clavipes]|nr:hypothetical protein TNCV_4120071 [Trichonephila clavipes]